MNPLCPKMWAKHGLAILMQECPLSQAVDRAILGRVHAFLRNRPAIRQTVTYSIDRHLGDTKWKRGAFYECGVNRPEFISPPSEPLAEAIKLNQFFFDSFKIKA